MRISEHQLDLRQTSRHRRATLKRQVLILLATQPASLAALRRGVIASNEDLSGVLRSMIEAAHVERRRSARSARSVTYHITAEGREFLDRLAIMRAPRCGEYSARLREILAREVLDAEEIALRLFGSADRKNKSRARSLAHYAVRTGHAAVEHGTFGPPELALGNARRGT